MRIILPLILAVLAYAGGFMGYAWAANVFKFAALILTLLTLIYFFGTALLSPAKKLEMKAKIKPDSWTRFVTRFLCLAQVLIAAAAGWWLCALAIAVCWLFSYGLRKMLLDYEAPEGTPKPVIDVTAREVQ